MVGRFREVLYILGDVAEWLEYKGRGHRQLSARGGRTGSAEGQGFKPGRVKQITLENGYLSVRSMAFGNYKVEQGLVSSVSGYCD